MQAEPTKISSGLIAGTVLNGCSLIEFDEKKDSRGSFTEVFQDHWNTCITPVQWSVVRSEARVFRGMHLHKRHDEYFSLISGHCYVGLMDIRAGSPTEGQYALYEFHEDMPCGVAFPKGLLHGWYFVKPSTHLQSVSESYASYGPDDNWGCRWDSPDLPIPWPFESPILSQRADNFPSVNELKVNLQGTGVLMK